MIKITEVKSEHSLHEVEIVLLNESSEVFVTDILILVETLEPQALSFIRDDRGEPVTATSVNGRIWSATFNYKSAYNSIYAIAVRRDEDLKWSKKRDLSALSRIGSESQSSLEGKLQLLNDFGWTPIGYTFYGVSNLRPATDGNGINQINTSNLCQTNLGSCRINGFSKVGSTCSCQFWKGSKEGIVVSDN